MVDSEAAFDRLPEAVLILCGGRVVLANRRARQLLLVAEPVGYGIDEIASFFEDTGVPVRFPTSPPVVGDRYAERIVHLEVLGRRRALALQAQWSEGQLVVTLRNAGRREAAVRTQGDVVATVAHEIRSPLTSVKGFTRTLLSRWERFSDEQKLTMLATIEEDADRVTRLLTDLLEVARIDAGRVRLHRSTVDVLRLAESVADKARMRGTTPELQVTAVGTPARISGDRDKLEQILTNLVDNALRHAADTPVSVTVTETTGAVLVSVADAGPGVDPATAQELFRKFARAQAGRTSGTGLGLYLAKGLAEAHGGRVWFDPDVSVGATVHLELPLSGS